MPEATKATKTTKATRATAKRLDGIERDADAAIRRFASAARANGKPRPWDELDPYARYDRGVTIRTNAWERKVLAVLAGLKGSSVQAVISDLIRRHAAEEIERAERGAP